MTHGWIGDILKDLKKYCENEGLIDLYIGIQDCERILSDVYQAGSMPVSSINDMKLGDGNVVVLKHRFRKA